MERTGFSNRREPEAKFSEWIEVLGLSHCGRLATISWTIPPSDSTVQNSNRTKQPPSPPSRARTYFNYCSSADVAQMFNYKSLLLLSSIQWYLLRQERNFV